MRPNPALQPDAVQVTTPMADRTKAKPVGQMRHRPGLTVFEYDPATGQLQPAPVEAFTKNLVTGNVLRRLVVRPGCHYVQALNRKNAARKLNLAKAC